MFTISIYRYEQLKRQKYLWLMPAKLYFFITKSVNVDLIVN